MRYEATEQKVLANHHEYVREYTLENIITLKQTMYLKKMVLEHVKKQSYLLKLAFFSFQNKIKKMLVKLLYLFRD